MLICDLWKENQYNPSTDQSDPDSEACEEKDQVNFMPTAANTMLIGSDRVDDWMMTSYWFIAIPVHKWN